MTLSDLVTAASRAPDRLRSPAPTTVCCCPSPHAAATKLMQGSAIHVSQEGGLSLAVSNITGHKENCPSNVWWMRVAEEPPLKILGRQTEGWKVPVVRKHQT